MANLPRYVLITPARNEAAFVELTIKSVFATIRPVKWVIVSDGSTDATESIVERYLVEHKWIELEKRPARSGLDYIGKNLHGAMSSAFAIRGSMGM